MNKNVSALVNENKKLMLQLSKLDLKTDEGKAMQALIKQKMNANNQEMQAYAVALGDREQMPRLGKYQMK